MVGRVGYAPTTPAMSTMGQTQICPLVKDL